MAAGRQDEPSRAQGRLTQLLDLAARQLNTRGVSPASLAELAASLGLTRAALYGYVADREDLVFQCYRRACTLVSERLAAASAEGGDAFDRLESFIGRVLDPDAPEAAALHEMAFLRPDHRAEIETAVADQVAQLAALLRAGRAAGLVREADDEVAARSLLSLVHWLKLAPRWLSEEAELPRDRLLRAARRMLFEGLAARPVAPPSDAVDLDGLAAALTPAATDRAAQTAARRELILAGASALFNRRGVESTAFDDIAQAVAVSKRTIFNHFPDKAALLSACQLRGYAIFVGIGEQAAAWPGTRAESVAAGVYASALASDRADLSPLRVASGLPDVQGPAREAAAQASMRLQAQYLAQFTAGAAEGSLREVDIRPTLMAMAGVSNWVANAGPALAGRAPTDVAREIAALVMNGLRRR